MLYECESGVFCQKCRDREGLGGIRTAVGALLKLDGEFECPYGVRWGWKPTLRKRVARRIRLVAAVWRQPSRGLGDTIAKLTKTFGVQPCCACTRRQDYWNKRFPYRSKRHGDTRVA